MNHAFLSILTCTTILCTGCSRGGLGTPGSGVPKTETRKLEAFDAIEFNGAGTVDIKIGEPPSLVITCDDNLLHLIDTVVKDGRLVIRPREKIRDYKLEIDVTVADLGGLTVNGAAEVWLAGLDNDQLQISLRGASRVNVGGQTGRCDISVAGAGDVNTSRLLARTVKVDLDGAGKADVHASESLDVSIRGLGSVVYTGNPKVTKEIAGLGKLSKKR